MSDKSTLNAFLHPVKVEDQEIVISRRFLGEGGQPVPFIIRAISQAENDELIRQSTRRENVKGRMVETMDKVEYGRRVVVAATVQPDFRDEDLCKTYGTMRPLEVPGRMLLAGEYDRLSNAILELSGLGDDLGEAAKN